MCLRSAVVLGLVLVVSVAHGEVSVSLTPDNFIVFSGDGEALGGVEVVSPAGALIPIPPGDLAADAAPFMFLLANNNKQIVWGNLGSTVTLEGNVVTQAGFDRSIGDPGFASNWGDGSTLRPVTIADGAFGACTTDCPLPPINVGLTRDARLEVTGAGHQLDQLSFRSESGSLAVATSPAPFAATPINSPQEIQFASGGAPVAIDGTLVLNAGWDDHLYTRDIVYSWRESGGETSTERSIASHEYTLPNPQRIGISLSENNNFVIEGSNHPVTELSIRSNALIPGANPAPFASQQVSGNRIVYAAEGSHVNIDGSVVLDSKWDEQKGTHDVLVRVSLVGDLPGQSLRLRTEQYPNPPLPPANSNPGVLALSLDGENSFVVSGNGVRVSGLLFRSESGGIRPIPDASDASPFSFMLSNNENEVLYGNLGSTTLIDGSLTLTSGWKADAPENDLVFQWGDGPSPISVFLPDGFYSGGVTGGGIPAVSVAAGRGIVLTEFDEAVKTFTFSSQNGSLSPLEVPDSWTLVSNTDSEITFTSEVGIDPADLSGLQLSWAAAADSAVFVNFTLVGGQSFGPFSLAGNPVIPEPSGWVTGLVACLMALTVRRRRASAA